jgi:hypothetical protein
VLEGCCDYWRDETRAKWLADRPEVWEKTERETLAGENDYKVHDELKAFRPAEWRQLLQLVERRAHQRMRKEGMLPAQIDLQLFLNLDWGRLDALVSHDELREILAANPQIAASEQVAAALQLLYDEGR